MHMSENQQTSKQETIEYQITSQASIPFEEQRQIIHVTEFRTKQQPRRIRTSD